MTDSSSFRQAQRRVAARRNAREAEISAAFSARRGSPASSGSSRLSRLPFPLNGLSPAWDAISSREGTQPAFRVSQVDAELLDEELVDLLKGQVGEALKYFAGGHLQDDWSSEIMLALRAILFKLTVWDHDATYGAALQNLTYTDARHPGPVLTPPSRLQKSMYGLITVFGKYTWTRWEDWLLEHDGGHDHPPSPRIRSLSRWTRRLTTMHSAAALASFMAFLWNGHYRTLLDRMLRMRLAAPTSQINREVSFEYLNRQLVWHAFTEFLLFMLPLIGINKWRRWLSRTWKKIKDLISTKEKGDGAPHGEYGFLPERTCAICYQDQNDSTGKSEAEMMMMAAAASSSGVVGSAQTDITNPYETIPCGCIYCYVCVATRLVREEGEGWTCLRCGEHVRECKPWSGDVLEPEVQTCKPVSGSVKTVAFTDDVVTGGGAGGILGGEEEKEEEEEEEESERESGALDKESTEDSAEDYDDGCDEGSDIVDEVSEVGSDIELDGDD
ncbi:peroxisome assembly protein (Peroxin-2) [Claviceps sp. Clav32 group G5]|nr:peroxisome assembly protein (Peroxin-2) [Claviceps sp. Clav32 group G5]